MQILCGGMAELVDALDSKSCGLRPCQFESDYPYQSEKLDQQLQALIFYQGFLFFSLFHSDFKTQIPSYKYQILGIPSQNEKCSMNFFGGGKSNMAPEKVSSFVGKKKRFGILLILI